MTNTTPPTTKPATITGRIIDKKEGKFVLIGKARGVKAIFVWNLPFPLIVNSIALRGTDVFDSPRNAEILEVRVNGKTIGTPKPRVPANIGPGGLEILARLITDPGDPRKYKDVPNFSLKLNCCRPAETTLETAKVPNPLLADSDGYPTDPTAIDNEGTAHKITGIDGQGDDDLDSRYPPGSVGREAIDDAERKRNA